MIDGCDCPNKPDGGIFRRATLIKDFSTQMAGNIIVLDGGGALQAVDDQYTMGNELDKERTILNIRGHAKNGGTMQSASRRRIRFRYKTS